MELVPQVHHRAPGRVQATLHPEQRGGMEYALGVYAAQDIVANARLQVPSLSSRMLVEAFLFYFDNDAFIEFDAAS